MGAPGPMGHGFGWMMGRHMREGMEGKPKSSPSKIIAKLLRLIWIYKAQVLIFTSVASAVLILNVIGPYFGKRIVDEGIMAKNMDALILYSLILAAIAAGSWALGIVRSYSIAWLTQRLLYDLRSKLFKHSVEMDYAFFSTMPAGQVISRFTSDVEAVGQTATTGFIDAVFNALTIFGALVAMLSLSVKLTLVTLTLIPLMIVAVMFLARRSYRAFREVRARVGELTSNIEQTVVGMRVSQSFSGRDIENLRQFEKVSYETMRANLKATIVMALTRPVLSLIRAATIALLIFYGGHLVINNEVTIGTLLAFYSYVEMFFQPAIMLTIYYNMLQSALAAAERIFEYIEAKPKVTEAKEAFDLEVKHGEVKIENVSFAYDGTKVFENFNLHIKPGEILAVVGPTGAGKTTLANLILRLYDPQGGRVLIDGVDVRKVTLKSLRSQLALVPQEPVLFKDTVLENIRYGKPDATDEEISKVINDLGLEPLVESLPEGLKTMVSEGGGNLSVGQRQLINVARTLVRNPKIIILDEATSSVDPYTESILQEALKKLFMGRTCIIIAHRLSTTFLANRVIVLDKGKIIEEGTHEELLRRGGLYAKLYEIQIGRPLSAELVSQSPTTHHKARPSRRNPFQESNPQQFSEGNNKSA
ncbi:MAG: ABC transporter ATP-binding protein [Nitrososphaerota archaeon]|nr:ABC transporter ATP-binding protein/permease [Candidatus Bathyarchaeota archaeon]MDW8023694.1 ABC transporter ATP-binding protein [Nitrososphaerota archaeon]